MSTNNKTNLSYTTNGTTNYDLSYTWTIDNTTGTYIPMSGSSANWGAWVSPYQANIKDLGIGGAKRKWQKIPKDKQTECPECSKTMIIIHRGSWGIYGYCAHCDQYYGERPVGNNEHE